MKEREVIIVNNLLQFNDRIKRALDACLDDFNTWTSLEHDNGSMLAVMLIDILANENIGLEMSSIQLSSDPEGLSDFLEKYNKNDIIVMSYCDTYIILNEKIAAQYIVDWCTAYGTHPDVPALLEKIKLKYCIN